MRYEVSVEDTDLETREGKVHRVIVEAPTEARARARAENQVRKSLDNSNSRHVEARDTWPWYDR